MLPIRKRGWASGSRGSGGLSGAVLIGLGVFTCANSASAQNAVAIAAGEAKAVAAAVPGERAIVPPLAQNQRGHDLFVRQWTADDSHTPKGDGLGPMFNAQSCADCHNLGGLGGGGKNKHNVDLLNVILPAHKEKIDRDRFRERMTAFHPGFTDGTASVRPFITLHKFGNDPEYAPWRIKLVDYALGATYDAQEDPPGTTKKSSKRDRSAASHAHSSPRVESLAVSRTTGSSIPIEFKRTQRNTPALFGAGEIDSIPDAVIRQTAADQAKRNAVKGQVALAAGGAVGKFGWRGQTATLKEFVMGACANELGLEVPNHAQPLDPLDPTHKSPGLDLTQEQCDDLTSYVASLPAPTQRAPKNVKDLIDVKAGERLFTMSACATCHMEKLGDVSGIYSDLLLHDMGPDLADPVPVSIDRSRGGGTPSFGGGYYSTGADVFVDAPSATLRMWRTPPLWGVADSGPYLHDGRAATLDDAIMAHSGEATPAREYYASLPWQQRGMIIAFLKSLTVE